MTSNEQVADEVLAQYEAEGVRLATPDKPHPRHFGGRVFEALNGPRWEIENSASREEYWRALAYWALRGESETDTAQGVAAGSVLGRGAGRRISPGTAATLGMDTPWPLHDVLAKLIEATEHSLDAHDCDTHGHEEHRTAANKGKEYLARLVPETSGEPT